MQKEIIWSDENLIRILQGGGVVVMPTDTLYGIVGRAENFDTVDRIYKLKKRTPEKPPIILIGDISQLRVFSIDLLEEKKKILEEYWPSPISIILECKNDSFEYLHRGTNTLAFRIPLDEALRNLLMLVGPLIAPSANKEGVIPAEDVNKAKEYFGDFVDLYVDGGKIFGKASKLIKLNNDGSIDILRD